jgi:P4 family phage/plasmid primase-like protien
VSATLFSPIEEPNQDLTADREEISRFCDALFRYAEAGFVQFRTFRDKPETGTWGTPWESANVADLPALIDKATRIATKSARATERVVFAPPVVVLKSPRSATEADIAEGVALSQDCDTYPLRSRKRLTQLFGQPTCVVFSGGQWTDPETEEVQPKVHLHWRLLEPTRAREDHLILKECRRLAGVIVNSDHSAVPLVHPLRWPGSWHRKGEPRLVRAESNADREIDLYATLEILREAVGDEAAKEDLTQPRQSSPLPATDTLDVLAAMSLLPNGDLEWAAWNRIGMALWAATGGSSAGLAAWHGFSEKSPKYDPSATTERWRHYATSPPDRIGAGSIFHMAQQACPSWRRPSLIAARSALWAQQDRETREQIALGTFAAAEGVADQLGPQSDQSFGETDNPVAEQALDDRDAEIARLAAMSPQQYFAERDSASDTLGLKKSQLDECVKAERQAQKKRDREQRIAPGMARTDRKELDIGSDEEIANRVIADMLANDEFRIHSEGTFYAYTGRVWKVLEEADFQREFVSPYDGARYGSEGVVKFNKSKVESISWLTARNMEIGEFFVHAESGINCENGFVRFHPDGRPELVPHDADHRSRHMLPGGWNPAENFELPKDSLLSRFLNGLFRDDEDAADKRALLQEVAGAVVAGMGTRLGQPKAIVLFGRSANNGKSTMLDLLEGLVGATACSHISPHRFDHPNAAIAMRGKLLNTSAELTTADVIQSDTFKSAITGEPIPGKILYKDMVDFRPIAQHVIATNKLPPFAGGIDKGVRRRLLVLVFNRVIPQHEMIAGIADLILRDEYDLFLAWAIEGASRLIRNGKFTLPKSSIEALEKWTRDTDPVRAWIEARVRPTPNPKRDAGYTRTAIFQLFESWAVENGHRKDRLPKSAEFIDRLAEDFPEVLRRCEQDRRVRGIIVLENDWADQPALRESDRYDDSPFNHAIHELGERMHRDHQEPG